jgi:hypothetical protein
MLFCSFRFGWKAAVVGHPILQESADAIIATFDGVHKKVIEIGQIKATRLANLLFFHWPYFYRAIRRENATTPDKRREVLLNFMQPPSGNPVMLGLFNFIFPGNEEQSYGGEMVYLEVINLSRNVIHHGADYDAVILSSTSHVCIIFEPIFYCCLHIYYL